MHRWHRGVFESVNDNDNESNRSLDIQPISDFSEGRRKTLSIEKRFSTRLASFGARALAGER